MLWIRRRHVSTEGESCARSQADREETANARGRVRQCGSGRCRIRGAREPGRVDRGVRQPADGGDPALDAHRHGRARESGAGGGRAHPEHQHRPRRDVLHTGTTADRLLRLHDDRGGSPIRLRLERPAANRHGDWNLLLHGHGGEHSLHRFRRDLSPQRQGADHARSQAAVDTDGAVHTPCTTAVTFRSLSAARAARGVQLRWRTASELDTLGFHVYRERDGRRVKLSPKLIAARGRGLYSYLDRGAPGGKPLRYWIQVVSSDGSRTWRGPAAVRG